jgi:hypothetical protein
MEANSIIEPSSKVFEFGKNVPKPKSQRFQNLKN